MKNQKVQDERITTQRHKINSEAYGILFIALLASILIQQFLLNAPFEQYAAEYICFFGVSFYVIIRYLMLGINLYGEKGQSKTIVIVNSLVAGSIVTALNGVLNYKTCAEQYREDGIGYFFAVLAVTFISSTAAIYAVHSLFRYFNNKNQARIQKKLDEDE